MWWPWKKKKKTSDADMIVALVDAGIIPDFPTQMEIILRAREQELSDAYKRIEQLENELRVAYAMAK